MITAIVLVHVEADRIPEVAEAIAALEGVSEVYSVTGGADLIAMVRVREHEALADVIADRLSKVDGRPGHRDAHRVPHLLPARPRRRLLPRRRGCRLAGVRRSAGRERRRLASTQPASARAAAPLSTDSAARARPARSASGSDGRRATSGAAAASSATSAAAALSSTASRTGPASPARNRRATSALCAASPPRSASGSARGQPDVLGVNVVLGDRRRRGPPRPATVVVGVSSSSPSSPRNTSAERARGRPARAAITPAIRASAHPTAWAERLGRVGQRAEEVEDRRHAELAPRAPPRAAAPGGSGARSRTSMPGRSQRTRRPAAGVEVDHDAELLEQVGRAAGRGRRRLPCLTTRAPVPATTIADIVEMLTVCARSPPVPQVSTAGPSTLNRAARRASRAPAR